MHYHRLAHNNKNVVKKGDRVKIGQKVAEVGNSNGFWKGAAHVHWDIFRNKPRTFLGYTTGLTKSSVAKKYVNPETKGGPKAVLPGFTHYGWKYLDWNGKEFHPGIDCNSGAGDRDLGDRVVSPVNGVVEFVKDPSRDAWGGMVVIKEDSPSENKKPTEEDLQKEIVELTKQIAELIKEKEEYQRPEKEECVPIKIEKPLSEYSAGELFHALINKLIK